jgi:GNAT superfamily N-acetyltransferase
MLRLRAPIEPDWPAIHVIANRSVADVPDAGDQAEWLANRRSFGSRGQQSHFVITDGQQIVGYGALEREERTPLGEYRLFVVTEPHRLDEVGDVLLRRLEQLLDEFDATGSWFVEYASDRRLVRFLESRGYAESRRFVLPTGQPGIVLTKARPT